MEGASATLSIAVFPIVSAKLGSNPPMTPVALYAAVSWSQPIFITAGNGYGVDLEAISKDIGLSKTGASSSLINKTMLTLTATLSPIGV